MKLHTIAEARVHGQHEPGSLDWFLQNFMDHVQTNEHNIQYKTKEGYHIYDRDARDVAGIDVWELEDGSRDFEIKTRQRQAGGLYSSYTPLDRLRVFEVNQVWGPKD